MCVHPLEANFTSERKLKPHMFFRSLENPAKCFGPGLLATRMQQEFPLGPGVQWRK